MKEYVALAQKNTREDEFDFVSVHKKDDKILVSKCYKK